MGTYHHTWLESLLGDWMGDPLADAARGWWTGSVSMKGFNKMQKAGLRLACETEPE